MGSEPTCTIETYQRVSHARVCVSKVALLNSEATYCAARRVAYTTRSLARGVMLLVNASDAHDYDSPYVVETAGDTALLCSFLYPFHFGPKNSPCACMHAWIRSCGGSCTGRGNADGKVGTGF